MKTPLTFLVCTAWLQTASAGSAKSDAILALGLAQYEIGHYAAAAHQFRWAAEMGDARAPEMLALMYRFGERLYGNQIRADAAAASYWAEMATDRNFRSNSKGVTLMR